MDNAKPQSLSEVASLARELMNQHGLGHWAFQFDHAKKRYGCCWLGKKIISLSAPLVVLNTLEQTKDTILHEIAHALAPIGAHHGPTWVRIAKSIGCNGQPCYSAEVNTPKLRYQSAPCGCGNVHQRRNRPVGNYKCTRCHQRIVWNNWTAPEGLKTI